MYNNHGAARYACGDLDGALSDFNRALAMRAEYPQAINNRGLVRLDRGDLDGALADLDRAIELKPHYPEAHFNRGCARHLRGDLDGALADFDRALELAPQHARAAIYHQRGGVHITRRDFDAALADLDRAIELDPRLWAAYISRGNAHYHNSDPSSARDYLTALQLEPRLAAEELVRKLATDLDRGLVGILADCARHLRIDPDDPVSRARRGLMRLLQGRDEDAGRDIGRVLLRCPEWGPYLHRLIEAALWRRGAAGLHAGA